MKNTLRPEPMKLTEIQVVRPAKIHKFYETEVGCVEPEENDGSFRMMTGAQKRFHIIFYTLASLTGMVIVQIIWQIAVLTAK
jgi:hypothetical protein